MRSRMKYMNSIINVTRPYLPNQDEYDKLVKEIWNSHWLTNDGPKLNVLEHDLKNYLNINNIILTVNGHLALEIALSGLHLSGEVITTPFTFISTTHAIVHTGLTPVFCDIREDDLTIDADKIEYLITEKTTAILPVHVYGHPCQVDKIEKIAHKYNLTVLYDAAHTFGVRLRGRSLCDYGDASMLSFHATKLYHTIEGGAIICNSLKEAQSMQSIRNYGIQDEVTVNKVGGNAKMNEFQAAMGIVNLRHINEIIEERKEITMTYRNNLSEVLGIRFFMPDNQPDVMYNYAYFPILIDKDKYGIARDELYEKLKKQGINTRKYFYPLTSDFDCYRKCYNANVPIAFNAANNILALPLYNGLGLDNVKRICDSIYKLRGSIDAPLS